MRLFSKIIQLIFMKTDQTREKSAYLGKDGGLFCTYTLRGAEWLALACVLFWWSSERRGRRNAQLAHAL
jgi:hypothetical protein